MDPDNRNPRFADFERLLIPGIDCSLGERMGAADFDYRNPLCECGCPVDYRELDGWTCAHCDEDPFAPCPGQVRG